MRYKMRPRNIISKNFIEIYDDMMTKNYTSGHINNY